MPAWKTSRFQCLQEPLAGRRMPRFGGACHAGRSRGWHPGPLREGFAQAGAHVRGTDRRRLGSRRRTSVVRAPSPAGIAVRRPARLAPSSVAEDPDCRDAAIHGSFDFGRRGGEGMASPERGARGDMKAILSAESLGIESPPLEGGQHAVVGDLVADGAHLISSRSKPQPPGSPPSPRTPGPTPRGRRRGPPAPRARVLQGRGAAGLGEHGWRVRGSGRA